MRVGLRRFSLPEVTSQTGSDVIIVNACRFTVFFPTGSNGRRCFFPLPEVTSPTGSGGIVYVARSFNPTRGRFLPHPPKGYGKGGENDVTKQDDVTYFIFINNVQKTYVFKKPIFFKKPTFLKNLYFNDVIKNLTFLKN